MIGVIGGNGVAATNRLCDLVERKITASGAYRDAHHPEMIVWQATKVPSRSMFLEGRGPNWIPDYVEIAKTLKSLGCDVACMCCNTAHYAIKQIETESGLRFINVLHEVAKKAKMTGFSKFELFCSDGARRQNIYRQAFSEVFPEAEIVYPAEDRQARVTKIICAVKTKERLIANKVGIELDNLIEESSLPVILGCTDLPVAYSDRISAVTGKVCVDSLETLADIIVFNHQHGVGQ